MLGAAAVLKHAGVSVYPMATAGMQPPGKAGIPQSRAVHCLVTKTTQVMTCTPFHSKNAKNLVETHTEHTFMK